MHRFGCEPTRKIFPLVRCAVASSSSERSRREQCYRRYKHTSWWCCFWGCGGRYISGEGCCYLSLAALADFSVEVVRQVTKKGSAAMDFHGRVENLRMRDIDVSDQRYYARFNQWRLHISDQYAGSPQSAAWVHQPGWLPHKQIYRTFRWNENQASGRRA